MVPKTTSTEIVLSQDGTHVGVWDDALEEYSWFPIHSERGKELLDEMREIGNESN